VFQVKVGIMQELGHEPPQKITSEIFGSTLDVSKLTHLNTNLLNQLDLPAMDSFWFPSIGNVKVQGFIIRPPNFDPTRNTP
jgi:dipeptidyl aminopeptidase/acylaminoacyl peptidase